MAFKKGDPNINRAGRPTRPKDNKVLTNREVKDTELLMLLRKIKPHVSQSILKAAQIMRNDAALHKDQLKAATILLDAYKSTMLELYEQEDLEDGALEIQPSGVQVSFAYKPSVVEGSKVA